jgi:hypothetical protein
VNYLNYLINEQNISDINPLYELADTSRIPLQKKRTLTQSHSAQHTHTHLQGETAYIFTCLIAYLFAFYIYSHMYSKKYLSIADMLPHHHITYKDISVLT